MALKNRSPTECLESSTSLRAQRSLFPTATFRTLSFDHSGSGHFESLGLSTFKVSPPPEWHSVRLASPAAEPEAVCPSFFNRTAQQQQRGTALRSVSPITTQFRRKDSPQSTAKTSKGTSGSFTSPSAPCSSLDPSPDPKERQTHHRLTNITAPLSQSHPLFSPSAQSNLCHNRSTFPPHHASQMVSVSANANRGTYPNSSSCAVCQKPFIGRQRILLFTSTPRNFCHSDCLKCAYCGHAIGKKKHFHPYWKQLPMCQTCNSNLPKCVCCERKSVCYYDARLLPSASAPALVPSDVVGKEETETSLWRPDLRYGEGRQERTGATLSLRSSVEGGLYVCGKCSLLNCVNSAQHAVKVLDKVILFLQRHCDIHFNDALLDHQRKALSSSNDLNASPAKGPLQNLSAAAHKNKKKEEVVVLSEANAARQSAFGIRYYSTAAKIYATSENFAVAADTEQPHCRLPASSISSVQFSSKLHTCRKGIATDEQEKEEMQGGSTRHAPQSVYRHGLESGVVHTGGHLSQLRLDNSSAHPSRWQLPSLDRLPIPIEAVSFSALNRTSAKGNLRGLALQQDTLFGRCECKEVGLPNTRRGAHHHSWIVPTANPPREEGSAQTPHAGQRRRPSNTIADGAYHRRDRATQHILYAPAKNVDSMIHIVSGISVVAGLPEVLFAAYLAHELLHAYIWLRLPCGRRLSRVAEEGACNVVCAKLFQTQLASVDKRQFACAMSHLPSAITSHFPSPITTQVPSATKDHQRMSQQTLSVSGTRATQWMRATTTSGLPTTATPTSTSRKNDYPVSAVNITDYETGTCNSSSAQWSSVTSECSKPMSAGLTCCANNNNNSSSYTFGHSPLVCGHHRISAVASSFDASHPHTSPYRFPDGTSAFPFASLPRAYPSEGFAAKCVGHGSSSSSTATPTVTATGLITDHEQQKKSLTDLVLREVCEFRLHKLATSNHAIYGVGYRWAKGVTDKYGFRETVEMLLEGTVDAHPYN